MSTSPNGTSPQAPVGVTAVVREQTPAAPPAQPVRRQSHSDRPPVYEKEAKPQARQGRRSVRLTLVSFVEHHLQAPDPEGEQAVPM
jgi:hypothetical protein